MLVLLAVIGAAVVVRTWMSVLAALVVPRRTRDRISRAVLGDTDAVYRRATARIRYLPTLCSAFNRRETEVSLLAARAGTPPWGPELPARTRFGSSPATRVR